jgi:predicted TIM-barrel fold metal-dependent hydrolase
MPKKYVLPRRRIDIHNHLWKDPVGDRMIELMDKAGIETTLILGLRDGNAFNVGTNDDMIKAMRRHPGRFAAGVFADPRDGAKAVESIRRYKDQGACVVKVFPNYGYFPDDDAWQPFWDSVAELGMGVLSHCGWLGGSGPGMNTERWASYYSHPGRFEKVVRAHPGTPFIMAHMGGLAGWMETVMLTTRTPNLYVDCSPGQGMQILEKGGPFVSLIPPDKLMFGADSSPVPDLIKRYRDLLVRQGYGPHLAKVFRSNARGILQRLGALPADKEA